MALLGVLRFSLGRDSPTHHQIRGSDRAARAQSDRGLRPPLRVKGSGKPQPRRRHRRRAPGSSAALRERRDDGTRSSMGPRRNCSISCEQRAQGDRLSEAASRGQPRPAGGNPGARISKSFPGPGSSGSTRAVTCLPGQPLPPAEASSRPASAARDSAEAAAIRSGAGKARRTAHGPEGSPPSQMPRRPRRPERSPSSMAI